MLISMSVISFPILPHLCSSLSLTDNFMSNQTEGLISKKIRIKDYTIFIKPKEFILYTLN